MTYTRRNKILFILAIFLLLVITSFFGWKAYRDAHPESYKTFQPYAPTNIVSGLRITDRYLEVWENHPMLWFAPSSTVVRLYLDRDNSYITESKNVNLGDSVCDAINVHCEEKTTLKGQTYLTKRTYSGSASDMLSSEAAIYNRDGVRIAIQIKAIPAAPISDEDWSAIIDSFEPTTFTDLKVKHMQPGP